MTSMWVIVFIMTLIIGWMLRELWEQRKINKELSRIVQSVTDTLVDHQRAGELLKESLKNISPAVAKNYGQIIWIIEGLSQRYPDEPWVNRPLPISEDEVMSPFHMDIDKLKSIANEFKSETEKGS